MRLELLYRVRFTYSGGWTVDLAEPESAESQHLFFAQRRCEGRISGRFLGLQPPHRQSDVTFQPNFQGIIETDDGAEVLFDYQGYGQAYPAGRRQIVANGTHLSEDERYGCLNDSLSVGVGEVRSPEDGPTELVIEWAELVWEPISEDRTKVQAKNRARVRSAEFLFVPPYGCRSNPRRRNYIEGRTA